MHLKFQNVNDAFMNLMWSFAFEKPLDDSYKKFSDNTERRQTRNGEVLAFTEPMTLTYARPIERVLFNPARDANPFLHLYEALWMLAGRNDVAPLAYYSKKMADFSDDGKTLNGAYGYRWRKAWSQDDLSQHDQLDFLVAHLKSTPNSRRAVLSMWNVEDDLLKVGGTGNREWCKKCQGTGGVPVGSENAEGYDMVKCPDCKGSAWVDEPGSKDVACNLCVKFSIRSVPQSYGEAHDTASWNLPQLTQLDMTVFNRSNDLVWGALGTNYVSFTFLQEYVAARLGALVGRYNQISDDLHAYSWNCKAKEFEEAHEGVDYRHMRLVPLVRDHAKFEEELPEFVRLNAPPLATEEFVTLASRWSEPFFATVAQPMLMAFHAHKIRRSDSHLALRWADKVAADDWRKAAVEWLKRREKKGATT